MNCTQFEHLVTDVAADRIDAGAEARAHLAWCAACRERLLAERRLTAKLRDLTGELAALAAPAALESQLLARVAARAARLRAPRRARSAAADSSWRRRWLRLVTTAGSVSTALALVTAIVVLRLPYFAAPAAVTTLAQSAPATGVKGARPLVATPFYRVRSNALAGTRGVLRVRVPRATLAVFGLPYNPRRAADPITADLIVDSAGMVAALRFVQ
jgi:hypothetical protein